MDQSKPDFFTQKKNKQNKTESPPVDVVVVRIEAAEGDQTADGQPVRVEDLADGVDPHLGLGQFGQIGRQVVGDAVGGAGQRRPAHQQHRQQTVREQHHKVQHLRRSFVSVFPSRVGIRSVYQPGS